MRSCVPALRYRLSRPRLAAFIGALLLVLPLSTAVSLSAAPAAVAAVPSLRAPAGLPSGIEPLAAYVGQTSCRPSYLPGTAALGRLLTSTYRNTSFGGAYACGTDGTRSEHYDGRAIDWMNSVRNPTQAAQAASVISFLLATDRAGNKFAMARRMGLMYLIWNNQIWGAWDGKWQPYNNCAKTPAVSLDSSCHRNHMHISLSFDGAFGRTSFWSRRAFSPVDYGPCRAKDLNWAANWSAFNPRPCPSYPKVGAPARSSAAMVALVTYSGVSITPGVSGPPVQALQRAFQLAPTGRYDAYTMALLRWLKAAKGLASNYSVDAVTWRMLLRVYRPH